jgi:hypothetical protein
MENMRIVYGIDCLSANILNLLNRL